MLNIRTEEIKLSLDVRPVITAPMTTQTTTAPDPEIQQRIEHNTQVRKYIGLARIAIMQRLYNHRFSYRVPERR